MGMTIDEAIIQQSMQKFYVLGKDYEAVQVAIDTMRKYQQIEEIYKNWCYPTHINAVEAMNKLGEVLKNGND